MKPDEVVACFKCGAERSTGDHVKCRNRVNAAHKWLREHCQGGGHCQIVHRRGQRLVKIGRQPCGLFVRKEPSNTGRIGVSTLLAAELGSHCRFRRTPDGESVVERVNADDLGARAILCNRARGNYYLSCAWVWPLIETGRRYYVEPAGNGVYRLARIELDHEISHAA